MATFCFCLSHSRSCLCSAFGFAFRSQFTLISKSLIPNGRQLGGVDEPGPIIVHGVRLDDSDFLGCQNVQGSLDLMI